MISILNFGSGYIRISAPLYNYLYSDYFSIYKNIRTRIRLIKIHIISRFGADIRPRIRFTPMYYIYCLISFYNIHIVVKSIASQIPNMFHRHDDCPPIFVKKKKKI